MLSLVTIGFALESTLTFKGGVSQAQTDIEDEVQLNGMVGLSYEIWMAKWLSIGIHPYLTKVQAGKENDVNFKSNLVGGDLLLRLRPNWRPVAPYLLGGGGIVNYFPKNLDGNRLPIDDEYTVAVLPTVGAGLTFFTKKGVDFDLGFQMNMTQTDYLDAWKTDDNNDSFWMAYLGVSYTFGKKKAAPIVPKMELTVTPASRNVSDDAGKTDFNVASNGMWSVTENVDWLSVFPTGGTGDGVFEVTYQDNSTTSSRTGEITVKVGDVVRVVRVIQEGAMLRITPTSANVPETAGTTTFNVTANNEWTVTEDVPWLIVEPMSGTGNGSFVVNYEANTGTDARTGQILVTSEALTQTVTVVQAGSQLTFRNVNFDFDKYNIRPDAKVILDEIITVLKNYPGIKIEIQGHADEIGTKLYNDMLSRRRALEVKNYMVRNGLNGDDISITGFGFTRPLADNSTAAGRAQNRRAEFIIVK